MTDDELLRLSLGAIDHEHEKRETYLRAPFGWPGGKDLSKKHILPRLPVRDSYIETCGGSGIILLNRPRSNLDVFNDRDAGVTAFYRCLADPLKREQLKERLEITIHSREEFVWCRSTWKNCTDDIERAARWFYIVRHSFSQMKRNFARQTDGKNKNVLSNYIHSVIPEFAAIGPRLKGVQIENLDMFQCIEDYDNDGAVFYLDPNYYGASKGIYEHEIKEEDHLRLCKRIFSGRGFFALSGYSNAVYDGFQWDDRIEWEVTVTSKAQAYTESNFKLHLKDQDVRATATEVLYIRDNTRTK